VFSFWCAASWDHKWEKNNNNNNNNLAFCPKQVGKEHQNLMDMETSSTFLDM
jgi:hypothetical protein